MAYFVYIVECSDKTYYTGSTNDLEKRIRRHNSPKSATKYTRGRGPVRLVYSEKHRTLSRAMSREAEIKRFSRKKKELLWKPGT